MDTLLSITTEVCKHILYFAGIVLLFVLANFYVWVKEKIKKGYR